MTIVFLVHAAPASMRTATTKTSAHNGRPCTASPLKDDVRPGGIIGSGSSEVSDAHRRAIGSPVMERRNLWRHGDFMKLWTADSISQLGTQVTLLELPLTAVIILKANAFQVGVISTVEF